MLGHGQRIFSKQPDKKKLFVFTNLVEQAGHHTIAGVHGHVIDGETNRPLKDVEVFNETKKHNDVTNDDGNFHLKGLGEGTEKLTFKLAGYREETAEANMEAGESLRIDIKLFRN